MSMKIFGGGFFGDSSGSRMKSGLSADRPVAPKHGDQFANGTLGIVEIYTADGWSGDREVVRAIPFGETADRPSSSIGQPFFNGSEGRLELFTNSAGWQNIVQEPPGVSSVIGVYLESLSTNTFVVNGSSFQGTSRVFAVGRDGVETEADVSTVLSAVSLSAEFSGLTQAQSPYDMKILNASNLFGTLKNAFVFDSIPVWSGQSGTLGTYLNSTSVSVDVLATDPGTVVEYSILAGGLPGGMALNSTTGNISGTVTNIALSTTYAFSLRASSGGQFSDRAFSISITDVGPSWITEQDALVRFSLDIPYLSQVNALDDDEIEYSIIAGSLPAGLTLDISTGVISGTPTSSASSLFTVRASAPGGVFIDRQFSLLNTVPLWVSSAGLISEYVVPDEEYSHTLASEDDGTVSYTITSGVLPSGLVIDSSTGIISGTTPVFSDTEFTVRLEDDGENFEDRVFILHVQPAFATPAGQVSRTLQIASVVSTDLPASYGIVSGTLPAGVVLSSSGLFSGQPTEVGTFTFTVSLTDNLGVVMLREFSIITVNAPVTSTYEHNGAVQTYTVPSQRPLQFDVYGASAGVGGSGGRVFGNFIDSSIATGQVLNIYVGGAGGQGSSVAGGFNGGGTSGGSRANEGSGGGASDIRTDTSLSNRIVVAGGGGGNGGYFGAPGGAGGNLVAAAGGAGQGGGGGGGTQSSGGSAGTPNGGNIGSAGNFGGGGTGGTSYSAGGGGGGGGWYGGGGGGPDTDTCCADGGGGGGGSSFTSVAHVTEPTHIPGTRSGNGLITITYQEIT
jgi:hypothetical protein